MAGLYWSATQGGYIKCPVEGCNHIGIVITAAHCRIEHGMTREEVKDKYGQPINISKRKQFDKLKEEAR
ncbi:hypothetical protein ACQKNB_12015 [Lysinibacillus xylanilyticus]|uniref:hypothetical protein n=1 Tax=Lysinibacillus xylanilyticus TaxID=582475 RepID=UPI003CFE92FF